MLDLSLRRALGRKRDAPASGSAANAAYDAGGVLEELSADALPEAAPGQAQGPQASELSPDSGKPAG